MCDVVCGYGIWSNFMLCVFWLRVSINRPCFCISVCQRVHLLVPSLTNRKKTTPHNIKCDDRQECRTRRIRSFSLCFFMVKELINECMAKIIYTHRDQ